MNRTCKILPLLLLLPVLANAQTIRDNNDDQRAATASTEAAPLRTVSTSGAKSTSGPAQAMKTANQGQADDKRRKQAYSETLDDQRYVAGSQDAMLVSEICTYSQYTYTYTCK